MAVTRANVETILVARVGPLMTKASMDGTTIDGTNADLADPIGWALRVAGYTTADVSDPTTAEVAAAEDDIDEVIALADLRTMLNTRGNLDDVDTAVGPRDEKLSQLAAQLDRMIKFQRVVLEMSYGYGAPELATGTLTYEFAEHQSGSDDDE